MLFHEAVPPETVGTLERLPANVPTPATPTATVFEDRLEDALDQVCAPLIGTVPRADRLLRHGTLRQELDTLVAAHMELASEPEQAVTEAIAHFARLHSAPALRAAPNERTAVQQTTAQTAFARPATVCALGLLLPAYLAIVYGGMERLMHNFVGNAGTTLYRVELFAVPLLAGLLVGLLTQKRAVRGVFNACLALAVLAVLVPSVLTGLVYTGLLPFPESNAWSLLMPSPLAGYAGLVFWPLLGCGSAAVGTSMRRKAKLNNAFRARVHLETSAREVNSPASMLRLAS